MPVAMETPGLESISCGSTVDCLATTVVGSMVATNDGGALWVNLPPISSGNCWPWQAECIAPSGVSCFGPSSCLLEYSVGNYRGQGAEDLEVTTDLGVEWTPVTDPFPGGDAPQAFTCASSSSMCAGFDADGGSDSPPPWQVDIGSATGGSWSTVSAAVSTGTPTAISCATSSMCLVVGTSGTAEVVSESGSTWSATAVTSITSSTLSAVSCTSNEPSTMVCMAVGYSGTVLLATISSGTGSFSSLSGKTNIPNGTLTAVACDTPSSCSLFGTPSAGGPSLGAQTINGGTSFSSIASLPLANATVDSASCTGAGFFVRGRFPVRGFGHQMSAPLAVMFNSR